MNITKIGHCCLLIKLENLTILTDPGKFSDEQNGITGVDIVLITHEHGDHLHTESLETVLQNNPNAQVISNSSVQKILAQRHIDCVVLEGREQMETKGIQLEAYDAEHAEIFEEFSQVQNTGYFINNHLFYPGDAYCNPGKPVPVLALPIAGPWAKIADVIRYVLEVKPTTTFPVHDAVLNDHGVDLHHRICGMKCEEAGIKFIPMMAGDLGDF